LKRRRKSAKLGASKGQKKRHRSGWGGQKEKERKREGEGTEKEKRKGERKVFQTRI